MEWHVVVILFLGVTSIVGIISIVKLVEIIEDLRFDNEKLRIDLLHK